MLIGLKIILFQKFYSFFRHNAINVIFKTFAIDSDFQVLLKIMNWNQFCFRKRCSLRCIVSQFSADEIGFSIAPCFWHLFFNALCVNWFQLVYTPDKTSLIHPKQLYRPDKSDFQVIDVNIKIYIYKSSKGLFIFCILLVLTCV